MTEEGTAPITARVTFGTKKQLTGMRLLFKTERARAGALSATPQWDWESSRPKGRRETRAVDDAPRAPAPDR
ncbi:hypothetical protein OG900_38740 [Streptomyces sp. NBC_00433]